MIARFVLHLEAHRGYWPRVSLRRAPRPGDRVVDGGVPGILVRCSECGDGFLHQPDDGLRPAPPLGSDQGRDALRPPAGKNDHGPDKVPARSALEVARDAAFGLHGICSTRGTATGTTVPASRCPSCLAEAVVAGLTEAGLLR